jgi:uncharacterized cofD-like protein
LLRGLRDAAIERESCGQSNLEITAIVTVTDDGGSSGRLRRDLDILAPGDIRNCMVALAEDQALLSQLFQHRFATGEGLEGHSFGNLFLAALTEVTGDFHQAIQFSSEVLAIRGRIFPSTLVNVALVAEMGSGREMLGETSISGSDEEIKRVFLKPARCEPLPETLEAIAVADLITLGPGSLFTSVIPNLLVDGMADAIRDSSAAKVYICNLMEEPGETVGYSAAKHLEAVYQHSYDGLVDVVVLNERSAPEPVLKRYAETEAGPVVPDRAAMESMGVKVLSVDLQTEGDVIRHDAAGLAALLVSLASERSR